MKILNKDMIIVMVLVKFLGECLYKKDGVFVVFFGGIIGFKNFIVGDFGVFFRVSKKNFYVYKVGFWFFLIF